MTGSKILCFLLSAQPMAQPVSVGQRAAAEFLHDKHVLSSSAIIAGKILPALLYTEAYSMVQGIRRAKSGNK